MGLILHGFVRGIRPGGCPWDGRQEQPGVTTKTAGFWPAVC